MSKDESPPKRKHGSIQWVIDALGGGVLHGRTYENHKVDSIRADSRLSWCPKCRRKWNIYNRELWASSDMKLWKEQVCPEC